MIYYFTPYSTEKNLGASYNQYMSLIGDDDVAVMMDGDTCFLTPDYGVHIAEYVKQYPDAVLTCWTNRINEKAEQQYRLIDREESDMVIHLQQAKYLQEQPISVTQLHGFVSGFLMVIPKKVWASVGGFAEKQVYEDRGPYNLLGVDNDFTNRVRTSGTPILRMDSIYIWHTYRLLTGDKDKSHLI